MKHFMLFLLCSANLFVAAQSPQLVVPVGHTDQVIDAIFSKDSKYIATASQDNTVKIWDAPTGKLLLTLYGHRNIPGHISFSNNNKYIVTMAFPDSAAFIWNLDNGTRTMIFDSVSNPNNNMPLFSNKGEHLAVVSKTGIAIWDVAKAKLIYNLQLNAYNKLDSVRLLGFMDNDKTLGFFLSGRDTLYCIDVISGKLKRKIYTGIRSNWGQYFYENNLLIISGSYTINVIDVVSGKIIKSNLDKNRHSSYSKFSKDGKYLLSPVEYKDYIIKNRDTISVNAYFFKPVVKDIFNNKNISIAFDPFKEAVNEIAADDSLNHLVLFGDSVLGFYSRIKNKYVLTATVPTLDGSLNQWIAAKPDGSRFIVPGSRNAIVYNNEGKKINTLEGSITLERNQDFSDDGKYITTGKGASYHCWDIVKGKFDNSCETENVTNEQSSKKNNEAEVLPGEKDSAWKVVTFKDTVELVDYRSSRVHASVSPGGKYILTYWDDDDTIRIWDRSTGRQLHQIALPLSEWPVFSDDGSMAVLTQSYNTNRLQRAWDNLQKEFDGEPVTDTAALPNYVINIVDLSSGKKVFSYTDADSSKFNTVLNIYPGFSNKSKYFTLITDNIRIWETNAWKEALKLNYSCGYWSPGLSFNAKGDKILVSCSNSTMLYEAFTNKLLATLPGSLNSANFSEDEKYILAGSADKRMKIFDAANGKLLYTYFGFKNNDYLITDEEGHYDGSENARHLLYFNCGNELVDLNQVKDQLWVPDLAERIMKGDSINAPKLNELDICGVTPVIQNKENGSNYHFKITPRKGGLGESVLHINNIEIKRWQPSELVKNNDHSFDLSISKDSLRNYFVPGMENHISLKSYTANNGIASRGLSILHQEMKKNISPPNLYAVFIGVSDYKGTELDLKYASKDASDLSEALAVSARKLLNNDGKEHVFIYKLTSEGKHYLLPEKKSVQKTLQEIGSKAAPNDILFLFFAGHGVTIGEQKQFYFLTADASKDAAVTSAGISTAELTEWMKPANIKAQKRILILDACNSGQVINDLITIGKDNDQYIAARNDENAQQVKAIDKLNERSGMFILAASASNQSAYEMSRYSQGLLTYSLLKTIKEQPDILEENKFLNVSRWFNAAEKMVNDLVRGTGNRQEPQLISTANFNVGVVDAEVVAGITLPTEKPLFAASNFQNTDEAIADDDIELSKNINQVLFETASRGAESRISYITVTQSPEAYTLSGRYDIKDDVITVKVNIKRNKQALHRFEITGTKFNLGKIAEEIVNKATALIL